MSKRIDTEYCKYCDEFPTLSATLWISFENYLGETIHSYEETFNCPRCAHKIIRYDGYLTALKRRDDSTYIDMIVNEIYDLSDESKQLLRMLLTNFTVPSFSVSFEGIIGESFNELSKKRYIEVTKLQDGKGFFTINAYKLRLFDNLGILQRTYAQNSFISHPEHIRLNGVHYDRRKKRMEILPNTFTDEQKDALRARFSGKCAFTGKDVPIQIDHVIPVASGYGGTILESMLPIWQRINSSKCDSNVFEWYEKNGVRFEVVPELFEQAIGYIADLNGMTYEEYREYVYDCHNA